MATENVSNPIVAAIRSIIQATVAAGVVALGNYVLVQLGVQIDVEGITETLSVAVFGALVYLFNVIGEKFPIVNTILSLGFGAGTPSYDA